MEHTQGDSIYSRWWGDQGDSGEESAHPKPLEGLRYLGLSGRTSKREQYVTPHVTKTLIRVINK
jgi:hypothetical protein